MWHEEITQITTNTHNNIQRHFMWIQALQRTQTARLLPLSHWGWNAVSYSCQLVGVVRFHFFVRYKCDSALRYRTKGGFPGCMALTQWAEGVEERCQSQIIHGIISLNDEALHWSVARLSHLITEINGTDTPGVAFEFIISRDEYARAHRRYRN